ncbi:Sugar phosphate permease [Parafrankia irregularis]|uniref:Sugar phosphate permease n=1 Tax=Parafrankia irregularis TaxID=795642 RepID=A0A0S4QII0_9ACTN|nr:MULTISPECIES: MFS transporter [Parafrankia]MBE3203818.1 MFS transporter [Parafrankia sp. CH37]CUU55313.1 Sugar phosphate permease [Parafrankia irregularis]
MYLADARSVTKPAGPGSDPGRQASTSHEHGREHRRGRRPASVSLARVVPGTVLILGTVSLVTDISAEMVTAVLPLYLVTELGLSPLGFGLLDGLHNGVSAVVRLVGGHLADRGRRYKATAAVGYGLSALCKPALLAVHGMTSIGLVLAVDRTGKGLRTAPRDAMISLASPAGTQGRSFGVHRAMDTAGALIGPIIAFFIMRTTVDGFDAVFTVSFCVATTGVVILLLFAPGRDRSPALAEQVPDAAEAAEADNVSTRAALGLLRVRELRRLTSCAALLGLATVSDSFLYLLLQHALGVPDEWFPLLPIGTATAFLLLAVPIGQAADRFGSWRVFLAGHGGLLVAYGLLLSPVHGDWLPIVVLLLHGSFYAATDGVLMAAAAVSVPAPLRSSGLALVQTGQAVTRFACSLLFGAAWTAWGDRTALAAAAIALTGCVALSAFLRPEATTSPEARTSPEATTKGLPAR